MKPPQFNLAEILPSRESREIAKTYDQKTVTIHQKMEKVMACVAYQALCKRDGRIVAVVGPTGVGKSIISSLMHQAVTEHFREEMEAKAAKLPVLSVTLFNPEDPRSAYKSLYTGLLEAADEPLITRKRDDTRSSAFSQQPLTSTALALRKATQSVMRHRYVELLQIDEGQHLLIDSQGRDKKYNCNILKSFINATKLSCIIYSTYELMTILKVDPQLSRRVNFIHFAPYYRNEKEELQFLKVAQQLLGDLPIPAAEGLLEPNAEFILNKTLGCVGLLKGLFTSALIYALEAKARTVRIEHLRKAALPESLLVGFRTEIRGGAKNFDDIPQVDEKPAEKAEVKRLKPGIRAATRDPLDNPNRGLE